MKAKIAVLPGDGIGPEIVAEAVRVFRAVETKFGHAFTLEEAPVGAAAMDLCGEPPPATLALAKSSAAVMFGAIGAPKYSDPSLKVRPELAILGLRKELGLYANLRPVVTYPAVYDASPLKPELLAGVDIMVIRELTGGIYFGPKTRTEIEATDLCVYSVIAEVERVVRLGAGLARKRRRKLTSVDKANVLDTSRLWRAVTTRVLQDEFPDVAVEHMYIDAAAMHLLRRPADFDVVVTENMFGDILTDEASMLPGSLGLCASAALGTGTLGLYEPIHGSAPDIAGRGIANPYATILSAAMLLRHSLGLESEAAAVERAVAGAIEAGVRTADLKPSGTPASTRVAGDAVLARL